MSSRIAMCAAATLFATVGTSSGNPVQWTVESGGNGHSYEIVSIPEFTPWTQAVALAEARGGHLATVTSAEENDFIFVNLVNNYAYWGNAGGPWIGGFQDVTAPDFSEPSGGWRWITGEPWTYTNWLPGEPNNSAGVENFLHYLGPVWPGSPGSHWNDLADEGAHVVAMVVEYPVNPISDCNDNGISDTVDIATGTSTDANANGFPDDCDVIASGACFLPNGACEQTTLADCFAAGGSWAGPFVACDAATPPDRCLGDVNFDGSVDFVDLFTLLAAWGECL